MSEILDILRQGFWPTNYVQQDFEDAVAKSLRDSVAAREARLLNAPIKPKRRFLLIEVFDRNPDVVAQVRHESNGICAKCGKEAPFLRRDDKSPYFEVHHIIRLADDGDDTVENAIALCPNCHRQSHFG